MKKLLLLLLCLPTHFLLAQQTVVVINGGFEDGLKNWEVNGKVQKSQDTFKGNGSAKLAEKGAEISQYIKVEPKKDYKISVAVKGEATLYVSIKGKQQTIIAKNKDYSIVELSFNSGKAKNIIFGAQYKEGQARIDQVKIQKIRSEEDFLNPILVINNSFENRFNYWDLKGKVAFSNVAAVGKKSAKMESEAELRQKVKIYPEHDYRLDVAVKGKGQIFVKLKGQEELVKDFDTAEFDTVSLPFKTESKIKVVEIGGRYTGKQVRFDNFKIEILDQELDPNHKYPTDIIPSLTHWKVTLPINAEGKDNRKVFDVEQRYKKPLEIADEGIVDFEYRPYFYAENDEVVFRAHAAGVTTKGSKYPRSELRQRSGHGNLYWSVNDPQYLETQLRVTHVPDIKSDVCITQIHGPDDEPLRVHYSKKKGVYIVWNENNKDYANALPYNLGETLRILVIVNKGYITCMIKNENQNQQYKKIWKSMDETGYFKVGCYTQASKFQSQIKSGAKDEDNDSYAEVRVKSILLKTTYTPKEN